MKTQLIRRGVAAVLALGALLAHAAAPDPSCLSQTLSEVAQRSEGALGACVAADTGKPFCVHGDEHFPMQSVVKLITAIAVLDRVDQGIWKLDDTTYLTHDDLSVFVQPIADKIGPTGYKTTIRELLETLITQSDNTANDFLLSRLGGARSVQHQLNRLGIVGVRIDRDERHVQSDFLGMSWLPAYVDEAAFEHARAAITDKARTAAFDAYLKDERDTATPAGMTVLLQRLQAGALLSPESTRYLLDMMTRTTLMPYRLRAGTPAGWSLAHRTGTSLTWQGVTAATNDIGLLTTPSGDHLAVSAFVKASKQSAEQCDDVIAEVARAAASCWSFAQSSTETGSDATSSATSDRLRIK